MRVSPIKTQKGKSAKRLTTKESINLVQASKLLALSSPLPEDNVKVSLSELDAAAALSKVGIVILTVKLRLAMKRLYDLSIKSKIK